MNNLRRQCSVDTILSIGLLGLVGLTSVSCNLAEPGNENDENDLPSAADTEAALRFSHRAEYGPVFHLDGKDYYLHGPLVDGTRGLPGHIWYKGRPRSKQRILGFHFNTGPLNLPSWWSSDAPDGALLYIADGVIDTWSPEKSARYKKRGFVHYHKLETIDRQPHPSKVLYMRHFAVRHFNFDGGPRPWLAHSVRPGLDRAYQPNVQYPYPPHEHYGYVGCVDVGGNDPDFISVVGLDPSDPTTYGKIISRVDLVDIGDEVHHYGFNAFQTRILVPGLFSGRLHSIDIDTDPAHPTLVGYNDKLIGDSGYIVPHTVIALPTGGYAISMIGADTPSTGPGGLLELDANANFVGYWGPGPNRGANDTPPNTMYDLGINRIRNRMVTTSFGLPANIAPGITIDGLGEEINMWDYREKKIIQTVHIGAGSGPLEVRWLSEPGSTIGFTNAPGTSEIWRWSDLDFDGIYDFELAIKLPPLSVPTDILLSSDDRYLYVSNWVASTVLQYDIRDPFNPILTGEITIPWAQMMRISPDNRRLYVTNSLLSTWDDTEFPAGVTRNTHYGMWKVDIDHDNGGMAIDPNFFIDYDNVEKKNTVGGARPHQVFFDRNVRRSFGSH